MDGVSRSGLLRSQIPLVREQLAKLGYSGRVSDEVLLKILEDVLQNRPKGKVVATEERVSSSNDEVSTSSSPTFSMSCTREEAKEPVTTNSEAMTSSQPQRSVVSSVEYANSSNGCSRDSLDSARKRTFRSYAPRVEIPLVRNGVEIYEETSDSDDYDAEYDSDHDTENRNDEMNFQRDGKWGKYEESYDEKLLKYEYTEAGERGSKGLESEEEVVEREEEEEMEEEEEEEDTERGKKVDRKLKDRIERGRVANDQSQMNVDSMHKAWTANPFGSASRPQNEAQGSLSISEQLQRLERRFLSMNALGNNQGRVAEISSRKTYDATEEEENLREGSHSKRRSGFQIQAERQDDVERKAESWLSRFLSPREPVMDTHSNSRDQRALAPEEESHERFLEQSQKFIREVRKLRESESEPQTLIRQRRRDQEERRDAQQNAREPYAAVRHYKPHHFSQGKANPSEDFSSRSRGGQMMGERRQGPAWHSRSRNGDSKKQHTGSHAIQSTTHPEPCLPSTSLHSYEPSARGGKIGSRSQRSHRRPPEDALQIDENTNTLNQMSEYTDSWSSGQEGWEEEPSFAEPPPPRPFVRSSINDHTPLAGHSYSYNPRQFGPRMANKELNAHRRKHDPVSRYQQMQKLWKMDARKAKARRAVSQASTVLPKSG